MQLEIEAAEETCTEAYEYEEPGIETSEKAEEAIFTCKFPGCTRQYASTDGARADTRVARGGARVRMGRRRQQSSQSADTACLPAASAHGSALNYAAASSMERSQWC